MLYDFVNSSSFDSLSFIVMQLLGICSAILVGKNLARVKELKSEEFTAVLAIKLLVPLLRNP